MLDEVAYSMYIRFFMIVHTCTQTVQFNKQLNIIE